MTFKDSMILSMLSQQGMAQLLRRRAGPNQHDHNYVTRMVKVIRAIKDMEADAPMDVLDALFDEANQ